MRLAIYTAVPAAPPVKAAPDYRSDKIGKQYPPPARAAQPNEHGYVNACGMAVDYDTLLPRADQPPAPETAWEARWVKKCERLQAELGRVKRQLERSIAQHSQDCEVLRGQVKYAEQERDELLAALRALAECDSAAQGYIPLKQAALAAIAKAEGRAS